MKLFWIMIGLVFGLILATATCQAQESRADRLYRHFERNQNHHLKSEMDADINIYWDHVPRPSQRYTPISPNPYNLGPPPNIYHFNRPSYRPIQPYSGQAGER